MPEANSSLTDKVIPIEAGAPVVAAAFLGAVPVLALGDGAILLVADGLKRVAAHPEGAVLVAKPLGEKLISGGDDGRVVSTDRGGAVTIVHDERGRWIDAIATRADGAIAWSAGKQVRARDAKGEVKSLTAPTSVRGLVFLPKGHRLACAHYNGVSLWFPNAAVAPDLLSWRGSHLDVTVSPNGQFIVTSMQENALHGWRVVDKGHMRMSGYPGKTRSLDWSPDGNWLATSGADACILWPFQSKDGPMGKAPRECGVRPGRVSRVAFHPTTLVVALGYEDGWILLCRLNDNAEILVRSSTAKEGASVTALAWSGDGGKLLFGTAGGEAGLVDLFG